MLMLEVTSDAVTSLPSSLLKKPAGKNPNFAIWSDVRYFACVSKYLETENANKHVLDVSNPSKQDVVAID